MKLSQEEKDALEQHFKGKDIYDPSKAPEQETADFAPDVPAMNCGGEMGYAEGGDVELPSYLGGPLQFGTSDYSGPSLSGDTTTARIPLGEGGEDFVPPPQPSVSLVPPLQAAPQPRQAVAARLNPIAPTRGGAEFDPAAWRDPALIPGNALLGGAPILPGQPKQTQGGTGGAGGHGVSPDSYADLVASLKNGRSIGQRLSSGLAAVADGIMTGVARTNSSDFSKQIDQLDESKRKDLIAALEGKYGAQFKGQELEQGTKKIAEEARAHGAAEKQAGAELAETRRAHDLEAGQRAAIAGNESRKLQVEAAQNVVQAYEKGTGTFGAKWGSERPSDAEYNAALKIIQSNGAPAAPAPITATNKQTGHKIVSLDGGRTWKEAK